MRVGFAVLRIRTAHSTRVVGGSTSGTMGSGALEASVCCGGSVVETPEVGFGGGSAKSERMDRCSPEDFETVTYLRKLVAGLLAAIRYPLVALQPKLPPPHLIPAV